MSDILFLFHHIHHEADSHKVHHCGGKHRKIDPEVDYEIFHCSCGKHSINKQSAIGHATNEKLESISLSINFREKCPDGGWHIESGILS
ncbi:MAG TPA: hypothetical protein DIT25_00960 [Candidatus Moranbacteria bacterium]|nr:hypothetical protein [Candidatus Moranbacteria bacterium]